MMTPDDDNLKKILASGENWEKTLTKLYTMFSENHRNATHKQ